MPRSPDDRDRTLSDELLNSFIDRQITNEERQEVLSLLKQDEALANRVCELQRIKEMTRLAYDDIPPSAYTETDFRQHKRLHPMAASIAIFSLGLLLGLGMMQLNSKAQALTAPSAEHAQTKVLVHLTSDDIDAGLNTLDNIQQMLQQYASNRQSVIVEVIANGNGIRLLSNANRQVAARIAELSEKYDNLSFAACKNTINQMRISKGLHIELIPQVKLIDSGIVNVIKRQKQGWNYIRG